MEREKAIETVRLYCPIDEGVPDLRAAIETLIPELKENEDERIRKELIEHIKDQQSSFISAPDCRDRYEEEENDKYNSWLALLERLGEHTKFLESIQIGDEVTRNPDGELVNLSQFKRLAKKGSQNLANSENTCKNEPKFKVGDWIVYNNDICQIVKREEGCNKLVTNFGIEKELVNERNLSTARLWTIQDAKDGDVLCCESGWTCIFKALDNRTNTFSSYCFMDNDKWFCNTGSVSHTLDKAFIKAYNGEIHPATKKQRDLLFQKMKEAGYEWDAVKKELRKIEQKHFLSKDDEYTLARIIERLEDDGCPSEWLTSLNEIYSMPYQKSSEWSEEDENMLNAVIHLLRTAYTSTDGIDEKVEFLKSFKHRVQPHSQISDEDKEMIEETLYFIREYQQSDRCKDENGMQNSVTCEHWLKELEERAPLKSYWKPSEEQMKAIKSAAEQNRASEMGNILDNLFVELKNRCTWKPSEGQLECLTYAIDNANKDYKPLTTNRIYLTLQALYYDLKALCEK